MWTSQETILSESGSLKEKDYTFFWRGKSSDEPRHHTSATTLHLNSTAGPVIIVSVYGPTLSATPDTKNEFYDKLTTTISIIDRKE